MFGGKDVIAEPYWRAPEMVCFTDESFASRAWDVRVKTPTHDDPCRAAKVYKILPHRFLDCDWSIYLDASYILLADITAVIAMMTTDIALFKHTRDCAYDEADACIALKKDDRQTIVDQMARYQAAGYPPHNGLMVGGVIIRRHTPAVAAMNEVWWEEIQRGSRRDQLSFPVVVHRLGMAYDTIPGSWGHNQYLRIRRHAR